MEFLLAFFMLNMIRLVNYSKHVSNVFQQFIVYVFNYMKGVNKRNCIGEILLRIHQVWGVHVSYYILHIPAFTHWNSCEVWQGGFLAPANNHINWLTSNEVLDYQGVFAVLRNSQMNFIYADCFRELPSWQVNISRESCNGVCIRDFETACDLA